MLPSMSDFRHSSEMNPEFDVLGDGQLLVSAQALQSAAHLFHAVKEVSSSSLFQKRPVKFHEKPPTDEDSTRAITET